MFHTLHTTFFNFRHTSVFTQYAIIRQTGTKLETLSMCQWLYRLVERRNLDENKTDNMCYWYDDFLANCTVTMHQAVQPGTVGEVHHAEVTDTMFCIAKLS